MNTYQENKHSTNLTSQAYLNAYATEASQLPAYDSKKGELDVNLAATGIIIKKQELDTSGVGLNKTSLRDAAIGKGIELSKKMVAFAKVNTNVELEKKVKVNTSLKKMADTLLKEKLEGVYDLGVEYKVDATLFGVTDALLTGVQKAINSYFDSIPKPRLSVAELKELTKELKDLQKETDKIFDVIDALVDTVKETSPVFWQGYFNSRKIVNSGQRHLSMMVQVNDSVSGAGEKGVTLEIAEQAIEGKTAGSELTKTVKRTSTMGGVMLRGLNDGTYLITATKPGFVTKNITAYVSQGEMSKVLIELIKSAE